MSRFFIFITFFFISALSLNAQELTESIEVIESSVKGKTYYNFTISGDGHLSYNWGKDDDNFTVITIDLSNVTISKDITSFYPKLWINCIDNNNCIEERGRIGAMDGMYFNYNRTYLPANNEEDLDAMFHQLSNLIIYSTGQ
ncbi:MAG: hypothetical protein ACTTJH_07080 [Bacteroidales bacterium]